MFLYLHPVLAKIYECLLGRLKTQKLTYGNYLIFVSISNNAKAVNLCVHRREEISFLLHHKTPLPWEQGIVQTNQLWFRGPQNEWAKPRRNKIEARPRANQPALHGMLSQPSTTFELCAGILMQYMNILRSIINVCISSNYSLT